MFRILELFFKQTNREKKILSLHWQFWIKWKYTNAHNQSDIVVYFCIADSLQSQIHTLADNVDIGETKIKCKGENKMFIVCSMLHQIDWVRLFYFFSSLVLTQSSSLLLLLCVACVCDFFDVRFGLFFFDDRHDSFAQHMLVFHMGL